MTVLKPFGHQGPGSITRSMKVTRMTESPIVSTAKDLDLSTSSKAAHRKIPSTYPPPFSATPSESYLEWKRSVQCWIAGGGGQLPEDVTHATLFTIHRLEKVGG